MNVARVMRRFARTLVDLPGACCAAAAAMLACVAVAAGPVHAADPPVATTLSRQAVEAVSDGDCDDVSVVVRRCGARPAAPARPSDDALTKSKAAAKAAFDRRDRRGRDAALQADPPSPDTRPAAAADGVVRGPAVVSQRLETVNVTGDADTAPSVEGVLQRALNPPPDGVPGPNGTVSHYGLDGARTDCIAKCVGPMCCVTVRSLPNPARDSNGIGR